MSDKRETLPRSDTLMRGTTASTATVQNESKQLILRGHIELGISPPSVSPNRMERQAKVKRDSFIGIARHDPGAYRRLPGRKQGPTFGTLQDLNHARQAGQGRRGFKIQMTFECGSQRRLDRFDPVEVLTTKTSATAVTVKRQADRIARPAQDHAQLAGDTRFDEQPLRVFGFGDFLDGKALQFHRPGLGRSAAGT